jgi:hypothetical protein
VTPGKSLPRSSERDSIRVDYSLRELLPKNTFGDALRWIALRLKIQTLLDDEEQTIGESRAWWKPCVPSRDRSTRRPRILTCTSNSEARSACWITSSKMLASPSVMVYFLWRLSGCFNKDSPIFWTQSQL